MNKKLIDALNKQINNEFYSAYLYLSMAAYFESQGLNGLSIWMKMQTQEELMHAMKFFGFMNDRGDRVILEAIKQPDINFKSVKDVFEKALAHEQKVTVGINKLYKLAEDVSDNAAKFMLQWFITEQVEEEKSLTDILSKLDMIKGTPAGILMLDKELGGRPRPTMSAGQA